MLKHTELVFNDFLHGNKASLEKTLNFFNKEATSIYQETLKDDFIYEWNKLFIEKVKQEIVDITLYPSDIQKLPMIWLNSWCEDVKTKYKSNDLVFSDSIDWLEYEQQKLLSLFSFLELDKESFEKLEEQILNLNYDYSYKKGANENRVSHTIFYLSKISFLNTQDISKDDIERVLTALYLPFKKENKKIFETYVKGDENNIIKVMNMKKSFFCPEGDLLLYCFNNLIGNKELFIEALNNFGGINNYNFREQMKDCFREILTIESFLKIDKMLVEKSNSKKKIKV